MFIYIKIKYSTKNETHPFQSKWRAHNPRRALLTSKKCPKETKASTIISLYKFLRQWQVPVNQIGKKYCHEIRDLRLDPTYTKKINWYIGLMIKKTIIKNKYYRLKLFL